MRLIKTLNSAGAVLAGGRERKETMTSRSRFAQSSKFLAYTAILYLMFANRTSMADPPFPLLVFPVGRFPFSGVQGDFNSDGRVDLAVANLFSNDVSIL